MLRINKIYNCILTLLLRDQQYCLTQRTYSVNSLDISNQIRKKILFLDKQTNKKKQDEIECHSKTAP